jgi:hypothetical protein
MSVSVRKNRSPIDSQPLMYSRTNASGFSTMTRLQAFMVSFQAPMNGDMKRR